MRRILVCVAAVGVFGLAGCGGAPTVEPPAGQGAEVSDPAGADGGGSPEGSVPVSSGPASGTEVFGSTATWPDGVSVTVSKPEPFKPSEYAAGTEGAKKFAKVVVTLTNGSSEPVEAYMMDVRATSGDSAAESVIDFDHDLEGFVNARVMPGKSVKWPVGFGVPGDDLLVTVDWGFSGQPVTFQEG